MKYMCLLYVTGADPGPEVMMPLHVAFAREARSRGTYVTCDALESPAAAVTVRVRNGRTMRTDGPYAETKEALGGFYILECKDLEEAVAHAAKIPDAKYGSVEVRPIVAIPGGEEQIGSSR
jgi:hypothetical protein